MSEKPKMTKEPWFLSCQKGDWGLPGAFYIHTNGDPLHDTKCIVATIDFDTPYAIGDSLGHRKFAEKKAIAEIMLRAQHMDKLTKVARDAARLLRIYSKETKTGNGDYTADEIDALLSKIEGKQ